MANIYLYDITFLILFTLFVVIFLWKRRSNLKREGIMYLYRTRVGIRIIDYIGTKYKRTLTVLSYLSIISGYLLMTGVIYFLYLLLNLYLFHPKIVQQIPIFPLMPLVPYVPELFKISFLPPFYFTYWIIAIAVIAVFHEFAHGIIARRYGVKIKTTGFGFLGPFLAAFVEPDEKEMEKKPKFQQIAVLSAGTFANVLLTIFFLIVFVIFSGLFYHPTGIMFDVYAKSVVGVGAITAIDGVQLNNQNSSNILDVINRNQIEDDRVIGDSNYSINITRVTANGTNYLIPITDLKKQLQASPEYVVMYNDLPAIRIQLRGAITQIEDKKILSRDELTELLKNYRPGDKITIFTRTDTGIVENKITLAEDPNEKGRAIIGIGYNAKRQSLLSGIFSLFNFFRDPTIAYEPKWNPELSLFIYNLLWWLVLINFSVALINMWPVAIFDGGRTFMLTVWAITKSEKIAKIAFKVVTYLILASLILIIYGYFAAMYFTAV